MMYLYYGTSGALAGDIIKKGLVPGGGCNPEHIYLSTAYAQRSEGDWCLVEIALADLRKKSLHPDEGFLAERYSRAYDAPLDERISYFKHSIDSWQHLWDLSLSQMGMCSHRGPIRKGLINRVVLVPGDLPLSRLYDPQASIMSYGMLGRAYRGFLTLLAQREPTERQWSAMEEFFWGAPWNEREKITVLYDKKDSNNG